jgi:hypothetical protein
MLNAWQGKEKMMKEKERKTLPLMREKLDNFHRMVLNCVSFFETNLFAKVRQREKKKKRRIGFIFDTHGSIESAIAMDRKTSLLVTFFEWIRLIDFR